LITELDIVIQRIQNRLNYIHHRQEINEKRKQYHRQRWDERADNPNNKYNKILRFLQDRKKATIDELADLVNCDNHSINTKISFLRKKGYKIKFSLGHYFYGGRS